MGKNDYAIGLLEAEMKIKVSCYKYAKKINMILLKRNSFKKKAKKLKQAIKLLEENNK